VIVVLGEVAKVGTGQSAPQDPSVFTSDGIPFIRAGSLEKLIRGESENTLEKIEPENAKKYRLKLYPKDTIVFAKSGMSATLGRVYQLKTPCYVVSHLATLEPNSQLDAAYLLRWLEANPPSRLINNDAYPSIKTSVISSIEIPLPPLPEQKRIAAILDKADSLRRKNQQAIQLANKFLRAVFLDMFGDPVTNPKGWDKLTLSEVIKEGTLITYGIVQAGPEHENGVPYIRTGDFKNGVLAKSGYAKTDPAIAERFTRSRVNTGDLVYCIRASIGSVDIVPKFLDGSNLTQGTAKISPGNNIKSEFLVELMRTKGFKSWVDTYSKGATFKEITLEKLREAPVIVPPLEIQNKFICIRRKVLDSIKHNQNNIAELPLFESISQKAFAGKL
jgi:type I restriction enzyme S subunit